MLGFASRHDQRRHSGAGPDGNAIDGRHQPASQPLPTVINIPANGHALLRISDLDVSEYQTLASLGIPMRVVGLNARLLRDWPATI